MFKKLLDFGIFQLKKTRCGVQVMFLKKMYAYNESLKKYSETIGNFLPDDNFSSNLLTEFTKSIKQTSDSFLIKSYFQISLENYKHKTNCDGYQLAEFTYNLAPHLIKKYESVSQLEKNDLNFLEIFRIIKNNLAEGWGGNYTKFIRYLEQKGIKLD